MRLGSRLRWRTIATRCSRSSASYSRARSIAGAARAAASSRIVTSRGSNIRGVSDPTWSTPTSAPSTTSGTPSIERIPFSRRIGLRMSAWSTSAMKIGTRPAAIRPAKPSADRDPHPGLDLLLDPLGRTGDQLVALVVVQQDRHGVDPQDVLDALQKLSEEVLQSELGQRRIAEPVQVAHLRGRERHPPARREHDLSCPDAWHLAWLDLRSHARRAILVSSAERIGRQAAQDRLRRARLGRQPVPLDRLEHGLAVGVAALVLPHSAQIGPAHALQTGIDLRRGQIVVAEDRE